ncbi:hypothetical protein ABE485_13675 [Achromobacter spanius]|uniref:hypothetical protein n=1 Tax=Achromobacter spanius TaxID=217203 RepID=UPI003209AA25
MAFGLMVKDAAGNVQVQYTSTLPRILGEFATGVADGAIAAPELAGGTPFFFVLGGDGAASYLNMPVVSISGTTISWYFVAAAARVSVRIAYGRVG